MFIGELARRTGRSIDTLRWYEKTGLIPAPLRDRGGRRVYSEETLCWVGFLNRLKSTGMSVADMRVYARLRALGDGTTSERRAMLERHRTDVAERIAALSESLAALDDKIEIYRRFETALAREPTTGSESDTPHEDRPQPHR